MALENDIKEIRKDFYKTTLEFSAQLSALSARVAIYSAFGAALPSFILFLWQVFHWAK